MFSRTRPTNAVAPAILAAATISSALSLIAPIANVATVGCLIAAAIGLRKASSRLARALLWCAIAVSIVSLVVVTIATLAISGASTA